MEEYISKDDMLCYIYALRLANGFKTKNDFFWLHDKIINAAEKIIKPTAHDLGEAFCNFNLRNYSSCTECAAYVNGFCGGGQKATPGELKKVGEEILKEWKGGDCKK